MPDFYILPSDVPAKHVNTVLDFLNSVQSAEAIAARVEFEGERDVGVKVGQNILTHREGIGGQFSEIAQLMDVYHVGPERFTEIIMALTGYSPRGTRPTDGSPNFSVPTYIQTAGPPYRIAVEPANFCPWIGQEFSVIVKVINIQTNRPAANVPVTFESGDMLLSTQFGFQTKRGRVISSFTGADGSIRLRMRTLFAELLNIEEQIALAEALRELDSDAASPRDIESQFLALVDKYEDLRNKKLRSAIDTAYLSSVNRVANTINKQDYLYQWIFHTGLIRIYVNSSGASVPNDLTRPLSVFDSTATQTGIYPVPWKEWMLPWYQLFQQKLTNSNLRESFSVAKGRTQNPSSTTAEILNSAYSFVATQKGVVGESIGVNVVDKEIRRFLAKDVEDYDAETRLSIFPSLRMARTSITSSNTGTLALVNQTKADIEKTVDTRVSEVATDNSDILESINQVKGQLTQIDTNFSNLTQSVDGLRSTVDQVNLDMTTIRGDITIINDEIGLVRTDNLGRFTDLTNAQSLFDQNIQELQTSITSMGTNFDNLSKDQTRFDQNIKGLQTSISRMETNVSGIQNNIKTINKDIGDVRVDIKRIDDKNIGRLADLTVAQEKFDQNIKDMQTNLGSIGTNITGIQGNLKTLSRDMGQVRGDIKRIDSDVGRVNVDVGRINNDVSGLNTNIGRINTNFSRMNTSMNSLSTQVKSIKRNSGTTVTARPTATRANVTRANVSNPRYRMPPRR